MRSNRWRYPLRATDSVDNLAARGLCAGQIVHSAQPIVTSWDQTFYATVVHW
jgi:hypothetical protein